MYNKLFTKILDSSIWLAPDPHRLVWITMLAAMDQDGNCLFASVANVAARARVTREDAAAAIAAFEGPDPDSGDPENEGRRIERFDGGWHILNAHKYRAMVSQAVVREQTRLRVAAHRKRMAEAGNAPVTPKAGEVTQRNGDTSSGNAGLRHTDTHTHPNSASNQDSHTHLTPGVVAKALRQAGIGDAHPGGLDLTTLLDAGAQLPEFEAAAATAVRTGKATFAYVLGIVKGERSRAKKTASELHNGPLPETETPRQRAARLRMHEMTGGLVSAKAPGQSAPAADFIDMEPTNVRALG
jgi:hypothetical protein